MPNVYAYYTPAFTGQAPLIEQWRKSWKRHGWKPILLGLKEAVSHPDHEEFAKVVRQLPSVNRPQYELACWMRWLAFSSVGGGLTTDYDVINHGLHPGDHRLGHDLKVHDMTCVPCVVEASPSKADWIVEQIMAGPHPHDGAHWSDMLWFKSRGGDIPHDGDVCREFGGSADVPLTHYAHASTSQNGNGVSRLNLIKRRAR